MPLTVIGALGNANMSENARGPILDTLADLALRSLGRSKRISRPPASRSRKCYGCAHHLWPGFATFLQDEATISTARASSGRLNAHLKARARSSADVSYLASPVTGGAIAIHRFQQLFLLAADSGRKEPPDWAEFAWRILAAHAQKIIRDGRVIESAEDNLGELAARATVFAENQWPVPRALGVT